MHENSGFREAPHHPTLRAQAEKEAAYRPSGKGEAIGANGPKEGGEEREKEESREGSPPADNKQVEPTTALSSATGGSPGAVGGGDRGCTHHSFAVRNLTGGAAIVDDACCLRGDGENRPGYLLTFSRGG